jgi:hypothetical protein
MLRGFHAFRDDLPPELVCQGDDRLHDCERIVVGTQSFDK